MIEDIEIIFVHNDLESASEERSDPDYLYFVYHKSNQTYFFVSEADEVFLTDAYEWRQIPRSSYTDRYKTKNVRINLALFASRFDRALDAAYADGWWQFGCLMLADLADNSRAWDLGIQIGFPLYLSLVAGTIRCLLSLAAFQGAYSDIPGIKSEIIKDSAIYIIKSAVAMGFYELGFLLGDLLFQALSVTPTTAWLPAALIIATGLIQGIFAVMTQLIEEKQKYGKVNSSVFELSKLFISNFINGAVWQTLNCIPLGSLLAQHMLKPAALILGSAIAGVASAIASYFISTMTPLLLDTTKKYATSLLFFPQKNTSSSDSLLNNTTLAKNPVPRYPASSSNK